MHGRVFSSGLEEQIGVVVVFDIERHSNGQSKFAKGAGAGTGSDVGECHSRWRAGRGRRERTEKRSDWAAGDSGAFDSVQSTANDPDCAGEASAGVSLHRFKFFGAGTGAVSVSIGGVGSRLAGGGYAAGCLL